MGAVEEMLGEPLHPGFSLFAVEAGSFKGWVVAMTAAGRMDDDSYDAPTMFDGRGQGEGVSMLFSFPES
jgi:hypothetical protein